MPPRYAYWTILVDNQPTAFRSAMQEDLMPTFKRLKHKHPSAEMKWFQNGKLWNSRTDAQEAMLVRGERGRQGDKRQGGFRDRERSSRPQDLKTSRPEWKPKPQVPGPKPSRSNLEWKPKGEFTPAPKREFKTPRPQDLRTSRPEWKPKGEFTPAPKRADRPERPEWKPKGSNFDRDRRPEWKPKGFAPEGREPRRSAKREGGKPEWKPKGSFDRERKPEWKAKGERPKWTPKGESTSGSRFPDPGSREKRKWIPKEEYKRSKGISTPRDSKWRPGGEHKDPRQKYKDAKKAKWTKFKKTVRTRWESKQRPKKKDE